MAQTYAVKSASPSGSTAVHSGSGRLHLVVGTLTITDYTTGGDVMDLVTDRAYEVGSVVAVLFMPKAGRTYYWDSSTKKVLAYTTAATEEAAHTNIGAVDFFAVCKSIT